MIVSLIILFKAAFNCNVCHCLNAMQPCIISVKFISVEKLEMFNEFSAVILGANFELYFTVLFASVESK